jgi:hypothetical protein
MFRHTCPIMNSVKAQQSYGFLVNRAFVQQTGGFDQAEFIGQLAKKNEKESTTIDHRLIFRDYTDKKQ